LKSRTKPVAVSLAVAAMLTAACGSAEPESAEGSPDRNQATPTTVNVGALAAASDAGLFIADARGYFEALGIEMEYQKVAGGEDLIPLLSTGRLDVGGLALNAGFFNAIASGNDLDVVADKGSFTDGSDPSFGALVVRSDLATQITGPADLAGRTIAAGVPGSIPDLGISAYLETGGLALDDVTMTTLGFPEPGTGVGYG
jgi:NitT/TauT family transport system substrate-binding protein